MGEPAKRTGKPRGPYAKTAARRKEILDTALEVFGRSGFRGSSMREISAKVGLSENGVLHHFGGKTALLEAVLAQRDELDRQRIEAEHLDVVDAARTIVARNATMPGVVRLFATLSAESTDPEHPAHEWFRARYASAIPIFAELFASAQAEGKVRADVDSHLAARLTFAVMDGLQIQWLLEDDHDMVEAFDLLLTLLAPPPRSGRATRTS